MISSRCRAQDEWLACSWQVSKVSPHFQASLVRYVPQLTVMWAGHVSTSLLTQNSLSFTGPTENWRETGEGIKFQPGQNYTRAHDFQA